MTSTTIQISKKIKNKLFELINELEKNCGRRVTYDEAIEYLIEEKVNKVNKEEFLESIRKYQGILKEGEGISLLEELRSIEFEREENLTR